MMKKQMGVALFQVLLVAAVLTLLCLHINREAQQHIDLAYQLDARSRLLVKAHSTESAVMFEMLTSPWRQLAEPRHSGDIAARWTFNGAPMLWQDASIEIMNLSSLIEAGTRSSDLAMLISKTSQGKLTPEGAHAMLERWRRQYQYPQDNSSRQLSLQYPEELMLAAIDPTWFAQMSPWLTTYPNSVRNPFQIPKGLWPVYFDDFQIQELKRQSATGLLSNQAFSQSTGTIEDEFNTAANGPWFRIRFTVREGDVTLSRQFDIGFQPTLEEPVLIWDYLPATYFFGSHLLHEKPN